MSARRPQAVLLHERGMSQRTAELVFGALLWTGAYVWMVAALLVTAAVLYALVVLVALAFGGD